MNILDQKVPYAFIAREIRDEVAKVIQPFDPGLVDIYVVTSPAELGHIIKISSSTFDEQAVLDARCLYVLPDVDSMVSWVGHQAGQYFASLMNEPIPSNVFLGEN